MLKQLLFAGALALCSATLARATNAHPTDPNAVLLDSFTVHVILPWTGEGYDLTSVDDDVDIEHTILVWSTSANGIELVGDLSSTISRTLSANLPHPRLIFGAAADAAVDSAIARGDVTSSQSTIRIYHTKIVDPTTTGYATKYDDCGSGVMSTRLYAISWQSPVSVTIISSDACGGSPPSDCYCIGTP